MDNNLPIIYGEGGVPARPVNATANLISKQALLLLFVVSEGECEALEDIYFNDVSISEYKASFAYTYGEVNQGIIPYFNSAAVTESIGVPIPREDPAGITRAIPIGTNYIDIIINFSSIFHVNTFGDNMYAKVDFNVFTTDSVLTPSYNLAYTTDLVGKANSPYQASYRIVRPAGNADNAEWGIKIAHTGTVLPIDVSCIMTLQFITYYGTGNVNNYPGSALVAVRIEDAAEVGGNVPNVSFKYKGIKLMLPASGFYQASTGLYANSATGWGTPTNANRIPWDGTFNSIAGFPTYQYSSNLSWAIYNFLSDWLYFEVDGIRYPRGLDIPREHLAHFTFEEYARYCDELLSYQEYLGAPVLTERRYTLNRQFYERKDAKVARDDMLTLGNASLIEYGGLVSITWDKRFSEAELSQSILFTNQNVLEGSFEYASADITDNNTQINVTIQEIENRNRTRTLTVIVDDLEDFLSLDRGYFVAKYGFTSSDFLMLGCSSIAAGIRKGRNLLWDSLMVDLDGDGIVQFRCLIEAVMLHKGSPIRIHDSNLFDTIETGRVVSYISNETSITMVLDRTIALSGVTTIMVYDSLGNVVDLVLQEYAGNLSTVSAAHTGVLELIPQSIFIQKSERTTVYKVTNITKEDNHYLVEATKYDARKYDFIEQIVTLPSTNNFTEIVIGKSPAVGNIQLQDKTNLANITNKHFLITWEHVGVAGRTYTYQVDWVSSLGHAGTLTVYTKSCDIIATVLQAGVGYHITVTAYSNIDLASNPVTYSFVEVRYDVGNSYDATTNYDNYSIVQF